MAMALFSQTGVFDTPADELAASLAVYTSESGSVVEAQLIFINHCYCQLFT